MILNGKIHTDISEELPALLQNIDDPDDGGRGFL
jgi:hypothetical protein